MAAELPGAAFLQRRLARAQALPPAERSPEVQAFITSVELGRQICELLPLRQGGAGGEPQPALRLGDPATARRTMRAALLLVQADYLCPEPAVFSPNCLPHINAYAPALEQAEQTASWHELAMVLICYSNLSRGFGMPAERRYFFTQALSAAFLDAGERSILQRQLRQLWAEQPASQPQTTWQQLEGACHAQVIGSVLAIAPSRTARAPDSGCTADSAQRMFEAAASRWLQLEPSRLDAVARTAIERATPQFGPTSQASMQQLLRAFQLGQQQRSPYWVARCGSSAVMAAVMAHLDAGTLRAVIDSFSHVEPAWRTCKRLLPQTWSGSISVLYETAAAALPVLHDQLSRLTAEPAGSPVTAPVWAEQGDNASPSGQRLLQYAATLAQHREIVQAGSVCTGCGQPAVGLRACSRCRTARYCSRECQATHWPQHKRECRPA